MFKTIIFILLALAFILMAPHIFESYGLGIVNQIAIFIILAVSYNLINGVTGQFSLEPNGFVAVGAYVGALLLLSPESKNEQFFFDGINSIVLALHSDYFIIALLIAGCASSILALILSFAVFRVRGDYLAIVTLGFGIIIKILAINFPTFTNGSRGLIEIPAIANIFWTGGVAIIAVILVLNLIYSKFGRAMRAIRDDEDAAATMGINTFAIKTLAFSTSAFLEGVGGALLASLLTTVSPTQFDFFLTFQLLIIIVLGGLGSTTGAILGSVLIIGGGEWLRFLDESMSIFGYETTPLPGLRMVIFSLILILVMLFARRGIMGNMELIDLWHTLKKWRRGKK